MRKKLLCLLLAAVMFAGLLPGTVFSVFVSGSDTEGEFIQGIKYTGISLTLADEIRMNFYMELPDDARENGEMVFTVGNRRVEAELQTNRDGCYFTCPVTALEMATDIKAEFTYGEKYTEVFTVAEYIDYILNEKDESGNDYSAETKILAKKIAAYGHYAQKYLASIHENVTVGEGGYAEMPKYSEADIDVPSDTDALTDTFTSSEATDNFALYGRTANFDSATALNYYITAKGGALTKEAVTVEDESGVGREFEVKPYKGSIYTVSVKGILATELQKRITVTVGGEFTLTGSVLDYCGAVVSAHSGSGAIKRGEKDTPAINAMAALYEYHKAAMEYISFKLHFDTPRNYKIFTASGEEITEETTVKCYEPFSFRLVPDDNYAIKEVYSEGTVEPDENGLYTVSFVGGEHDVVVYAETETVTLTVTVEGEEGGGMPDTKVSFEYGAEVVWGQASAPGVYTIDVPKGVQGDVVVKKTGYREYRENYTADGISDEITVNLIPGGN